MDGERIDALSRRLAGGVTRRGVVRTAGAGGFLATIAMLFGRGNASAIHDGTVEPDPVTCTWEIEAHGSVGPNAADSYNGILKITIEHDDMINEGKYVLVDADWNPLLDADGNEIAYRVVGTAHLRSIDFRAERGECDELAFTGVNRLTVRDCGGPMSGSFQGPELVDLGGWRTRLPDDTCGPCNGLVCKRGHFVDTTTCTCCEECPRDTVICNRRFCVPNTCGKGEVFNEDQCICTCEQQVCVTGEYWDRESCGCLPYEGCEEVTCAKGYYFDKDACDCLPQDDPCEEVACDGRTIWDPIYCTCVCAPQDCQNGGTWDSDECACITVCEPLECAKGYVFDKEICDCVSSCLPGECSQGEYFDYEACECLPLNTCPPCLDGFVLDPSTCQCSCPAGLADCQGYCLDLLTDNANCGGCYDACSGNEICREGTCVS